MNANNRVPEQVRIGVAAVLLFALSAPLAVLGPYGGSSEAREAQVAWVVWSEGAWLFPDRNGLVPSKPPLFHWLTASLATLFGWFPDGLPRLVSLISAVALMVLTAFGLRHLLVASGRYSAQEIEVGVSLGFALMASTYGVVAMAGTAMVDMLFATLVGAALLTVVRELSSQWGRPSVGGSALGPRAMASFWILCGLAVLTKGPLGAALPLVISGVLIGFFHGAVTAIRSLALPLWGPALGLIVGCSWYLTVAAAGKWEVLERQILFENVQRITGGEEMNSEVWWFYAPEFLRSGLPWSLVFVLGCFKLLPLARLSRQGILSVGFLWVGAGVILFSLASGKRPSYLLPLYSGMVLAVVPTLLLWWRELGATHKLWLQRAIELSSMAGVLLLLTIVCFCSFPQFWAHVAPPVASNLASLFTTGFVSAVGGWLVVALVGGRFVRSPVMRGFTILIAVLSVAVWGGRGIKNALREFDVVAQEIRASYPDTVPLYAVRERSDELLDPILYYLKRRVMVLSPTSIEAIPNGGVVFGRKEVIADIERSGATFRLRSEFQQMADRERQRLDRVIVLGEVVR